MTWFDVDWHTIVVPDLPVLEVVVRGTMVYLAIFVLIRVVLKRRAGELSLSDMLFVALIADAAQNALAKEYRSVSAGLLLVTTILFWNYALDWLAFRVPSLRPAVEPEPLLLIRNGQIQEPNLRKELLTNEELRGQLREHGVAEIKDVREAYLESEGRFSVVTKTSSEDLIIAVAQLGKQMERQARQLAQLRTVLRKLGLQVPRSKRGDSAT